MTIFSENYDFTVSLLQLRSDHGHALLQEEAEVVTEDLGSMIRRNHGL
jgi:hypothetical protein